MLDYISWKKASISHGQNSSMLAHSPCVGDKPKSRVNCNEKYYYILIISSFVYIHRRVFPPIPLSYCISYKSVIQFSLQEKR